MSMIDQSSATLSLIGSEAWELLLLKLRYHEGELVRIAANKPLLLDDTSSCWMTYSGSVDVFAAATQEDGDLGTRRYLFTAPPGTALFATSPLNHGIHLLVAGSLGVEVVQIKLAGLRELATEHQMGPLFAVIIDNWVKGISRSITSSLPPREYIQIQHGESYDVPAGTSLHPTRGVLWVSHLSGASLLKSHVSWPISDRRIYLPVTNQAWLAVTEPGTVRVINTETLLEEEAFWDNLTQFNQLVMDTLHSQAQTLHQAEIAHLRSKLDTESSRVDKAFQNLASLFRQTDPKPFTDIQGQDPLLDACYIIGKFSGIIFRPSPAVVGERSKTNPLQEIARASGVRYRQVALRDDWWRSESGPLLAYYQNDTCQPVALLPSTRGYDLHDPITRSITRVSEELSYTLSPFAYTFYRPFPGHAIHVMDLLRAGLKGTGPELGMLIWMGVLSGLISLVVPVVTSFLFDTIIPTSQRDLLAQIGVGLLASALAVTIFSIVHGIALLRLEARVETLLQSAMIDRLLNLPAIFFRGYTAGDLGQRVMGISAIREALSRRVLIIVLAFVFSIFSLLILFYYDAELALIAVGLVGVLMIAIFLTAYLQMRHQRDYVSLQGRFTGRTLQLINGIAKLRVAGGQRRAFVHWSDLFLRQRQALMKVQQLAVGLATFNEVHSVIILMVIFGVIAYSGDYDLSTGSFVAFLTAFTQFVVATVAVSSALSSLISVIPLYERAQPILTTLPEVSQEKHHPGELSGRIAVSRVSFRYSEDGLLVLDDITIEADPGEFVAIVGPSGSGKSTLLRLLLGFEVPQKGSTLYDGQDLAMLDVQSVRQQIGVVLQNGKLFTGTIFSNIVGAAQLTVDDAWDAARKSGLAEDIKAMPMRMHTIIGEGAKTISGGQKQRLLIARAIVNKPRMIIFDEATSALDNRSQAIVSQSLEELDATRIVIAHRLSTIAHADRIYVFDHGRIVQQGTYAQLAHEHGLFADLARRQLV